MAVVKYISLENLTLYDELIKQYIDVEDAKSLKTVMLSQDGWSLNFYRTSEPIASGATPAYSIDLPKTNLDHVMKKIVTALQGDLPVFDSSGGVIDSGVKLSDLITETEAQTLINQAITASQHISKQIVSDISTVTEPAENVIYMVLDNSVTGEDKYKEYMLIGGTLTLIGSTSTNLGDYLTIQQITDRLTALRTEILATAATDAQNKADAAEANANTYTDQQITILNAKIDELTDLSGFESRLDTMETNISNNSTRIGVLESKVNNMDLATEADIRALFAADTP